MNEDEFLEQLASQDLSTLSNKQLKSYKKRAEKRGWAKVANVIGQATHGPTRTFLSDAADALAFNFADEVMAGIRAPFSKKSYSDILGEYDAGRKARASRNPRASLAGDIAGNVAGTAGAILVPGGQASLLGRLAGGGALKAAGRAATVGATGEGAREVGRENVLGRGDIGSPLAKGIAIGATLGGITGGGARLGELAIKRLRSRVGLKNRSPLEKKAIREVSLVLGKERIDPINNPVKKGLQNLNNEAMLVDASRELQELGGAMVRRSDAASDPLSAIAGRRAEGAPQRISGALDRIVHPYSDAMGFIPENKEAITAAQRRYDDIFKESGPVDITGLLKRNKGAGVYSGNPNVAGELSRIDKQFRQRPFTTDVLDDAGEVVDQEIHVPPKSLFRGAQFLGERGAKAGGGEGIELQNAADRMKNLLREEVEGFSDAQDAYEQLLRGRSNFEVGANIFRGRPDYDLITDIKKGQRYDPLDDNTVAKGMRVGMEELIDRSPRAEARLYSEVAKPITGKFLRDLGPANVDKALAKELGIESAYSKTHDILESARVARDREAAASLFSQKEPNILHKVASIGLSGLTQNAMTLPSRGQRNLIKGSVPVRTFNPAANVSPVEVRRFLGQENRQALDDTMMKVLASQGKEAAGYADDISRMSVAQQQAEELAKRLRAMGIFGGIAGTGAIGEYYSR